MSKLSILKQKNKRDVDMTQGSIFRHLITFAFPLLIGNIFQQLYNIQQDQKGRHPLDAEGAAAS